ncbi:GTP cyclohydrolase 1 type 2/Nif3 [Hypoxylon rubiginosum]|uniref:GTP cyclohydrolase 1 type 2/Nif3 n=1 Tax=Hypoxylon rubiginosum TaxID=110542 RepID=A0ACC0CLC0_9PEZI|nr:GTP cyclohydrolase 1 type 2/Nif3 [Hypoxylon rubiginosum]
MASISSTPPRFKLVFRVPPSALAACKTAIFAAGAGRYPGPGNYTGPPWALGNSARETPQTPTSGRAHPYEEPGYEVYRVEDF